jgi:heat shock protein 90kDa beta
LSRFYSRVERVLRRSLGVSQTAKADTEVKPAPPVDPKLEEGEETEETKEPYLNIPSELKDHISVTVEEINAETTAVHDEL